MLCSVCGKLPISNKRHGTCLYCERKRKGKESSICVIKKTPIKLSQKNIEKMKKNRLEKAKSKSNINTPLKAKVSIKTSKPIKSVSSKQSKVNSELQNTYNEIKQTREPICQGCGLKKPLSFSHTISRKKRKDLQTDIDNIELECFGDSTSCHDIWEHLKVPEVFNLLNFDRKMLYIKQKDPELYIRIQQKLQDKIAKS